MSNTTGIHENDNPAQARAAVVRPAGRIATTIGWVLAPIYLGLFGVSIVLGSIVLSSARILWDHLHAPGGKPERAKHQDDSAFMVGRSSKKSGGTDVGDWS